MIHQNPRKSTPMIMQFLILFSFILLNFMLNNSLMKWPQPKVSQRLFLLAYFSPLSNLKSCFPKLFSCHHQEKGHNLHRPSLLALFILIVGLPQDGVALSIFAFMLRWRRWPASTGRDDCRQKMTTTATISFQHHWWVPIAHYCLQTKIETSQQQQLTRIRRSNWSRAYCA